MFLRTKIPYAGLILGLFTAFGASQAQQPSTQTPAVQTPAESPARMGRTEGRGFRRRPGPGVGFGRGALRELNLSDAQQQQVRTIIQQDFESSKTLREELRQLGEKRSQGTLTAEEQTRARTLHEQMRASIKDRETKIAAVLTAEQKTKLEAFMKERSANRAGFGGRRRGFRGKPGPGSPPAPRPSNPPSNQ